ncbi:MAG: hypothetical protein P4N59_03650 [Negativicutes bacterium]|nr:hypothetical protein [Negativicutes bacterium]
MKVEYYNGVWTYDDVKSAYSPLELFNIRKDLRQQLATVTAERDAALSKLAEMLSLGRKVMDVAHDAISIETERDQLRQQVEQLQRKVSLLGRVVSRQRMLRKLLNANKKNYLQSKIKDDTPHTCQFCQYWIHYGRKSGCIHPYIIDDSQKNRDEQIERGNLGVCGGWKLRDIAELRREGDK